jgi:catechol 2,3-dioxygenase-like lactoylglutathione lyase family enzyme
MLGNYDLMAFSQTTQPERAQAFYVSVLGLKLEEDSPPALVFRSGHTILRVQKVSGFSPLPFTSLGWNVPNIEVVVQGLSKSGVIFERYEGIEQDDLGVWASPTGARVCWFKDPDGNTLSVTQF